MRSPSQTIRWLALAIITSETSMCTRIISVSCILRMGGIIGLFIIASKGAVVSR